MVFFGRYFCSAVTKIIGKICSLLETYLAFFHDINPFPRLKNFEIKVLSSVSGKIPSPPFLSTIRGSVWQQCKRNGDEARSIKYLSGLGKNSCFGYWREREKKHGKCVYPIHNPQYTARCRRGMLHLLIPKTPRKDFPLLASKLSKEEEVGSIVDRIERKRNRGRETPNKAFPYSFSPFL